MEHIIEMNQEVVEQLMKKRVETLKLRAPFKKFTLTFPNSVFITKEQVMADVLDDMLKSKGTSNAVLNPSDKQKLEKMASKYANGTCSLRVKCNEDAEVLEFKASLYDPMGAILMRIVQSEQMPFTFVEENNFSKTPLVTANALTNLIVGVIEYINSPSEVIDRKEVKELAQPKSNSKSKKSKKSKNNKTYIHKCYYSINNVDSLIKRPYERHTECWTTRGHWRTYKSGKKVWIKEQIRGKGKVGSKSYKINKLDK